MEYALIFDSDRCVSCKRCVTECRKENKLEGDWDRIHLTMRQTGKDFSNMEPFVQMCNHCENPGCIASCPVDGKAIHKREKDGVVLVDAEKCTGCGKCVKGCPFEVIHLSDWKNSKGQVIADKCTLCAHILDKQDEIGDEFGTPCVKICPTGALEFGKKDYLLKRNTWRGRDCDLIDMEKNGVRPTNIYLRKRSIKKLFSTS